MEKKFGALTSSTDPDQLANTVRGGILAVSGLIIYFAAQLFNIQLSADDIVALATQIGTVAGSLWMVYGLIQKVVVFFAQRR